MEKRSLLVCVQHSSSDLKTELHSVGQVKYSNLVSIKPRRTSWPFQRRHPRQQEQSTSVSPSSSMEFHIVDRDLVPAAT